MTKLLKVFIVWVGFIGWALFLVGNTTGKASESPQHGFRDGQIMEKLDDGKTQYFKVWDGSQGAYLLYSVDYSEWKLYKVGEIY